MVVTLKGHRIQEIRLINGKPHLCTTIGGIITKDLGEWDKTTRKVCGPSYYTENELIEKYEITDKIIEEKLAEEEKKRLRKLQEREESKRQREFEKRIKREREELQLREEEARIKKLEMKIEKSRKVGDEELTKVPEGGLKRYEVDLEKELREKGWLIDRKAEQEEPKEEAKEEVKLKEYIDHNKLAEERNRRLALVHEGHSVDAANEIIKLERKEGNIMADKRVVCGKARSCRLVGNKISQVFDDDMHKWLSKDEFEKRHGYNGYKDNKVEAPKITVTTTTNGVISSGTTTMIPEVKANTISVPVEDKIEEKKVDDVKVDENKIEEKKIEEKKIENKSEKKVEHANIIDEYVSLLYMNEK